MNIKVSVIIPVYNCEKYIRECIESLINQNLKECEFIFINDGSTDKSEEIIKEYLYGDERISLINQKNSGVSVARNIGIKKAVGEYIGFVDADDYVENNYFERLYNEAKDDNCHIVICGWKNVFKDNETVFSLPFEKNKVFNKADIEKNIYPFLIKEDSLNSVCNKIYKRDVLSKNNIEFPVGLDLGEDGLFNIKAFTQVNRCKFIDYEGYYYRYVEGSATRNVINKDYFKRAINVFNRNIEEYEKWPMDIEEIDRLKSLKLINTAISLTYVYFVPNKNNTLKDRYKYVEAMINNSNLNLVINKYYEEIGNNRGWYEKAIINSIRSKNTLAIWMLTSYSRFRNR
ncbi:glycosyltransferase family 2 protein [Clostridium sp. NSJ-6]|uniref:Glycosyltransferase family 2 protein n=1 Tax=Clostridium hominis TaxID=2763036 RepID=A0ABR7DFS9_9CLOT|nr:glycosyltransferase family 2 protein [Clostridium hominis]MBC5630269.1 glycosyltransferase family 2 protein [Clostridium hominis]